MAYPKKRSAFETNQTLRNKVRDNGRAILKRNVSDQILFAKESVSLPETVTRCKREQPFLKIAIYDKEGIELICEAIAKILKNDFQNTFYIFLNKKVKDCHGIYRREFAISSWLTDYVNFEDLYSLEIGKKIDIGRDFYFSVLKVLSNKYITKYTKRENIPSKKEEIVFRELRMFGMPVTVPIRSSMGFVRGFKKSCYSHYNGYKNPSNLKNIAREKSFEKIDDLILEYYDEYLEERM